MHVPAWPVLPPWRLLAPRSSTGLPFPLGAPGTLGFYLARGAIYHLSRALVLDGATVLMPAYHHGNEVRAVRAAGARVRFYAIDRRLTPDLDQVECFCRSGARALFVTHFLGWPQPVEEMAVIARRHGVVLVEDCALAFLSELAGRPLGSFGDYGVFCPYKTVAVPNGGLLAQNRGVDGTLSGLALGRCSTASLVGRTAELVLHWSKARCGPAGAALLALKRAAGRALNRAGVRRAAVGDDGFDLAVAGLGMSSLSDALLRRWDYAAIRRRRRGNFQRLRDRLAGGAALLLEELPDGVTPLFFPLLVTDKARAQAELEPLGIESVPFWNEGDPEAAEAAGSDVRFLRRHVLELPIHQDVTRHQVDVIAGHVLRRGLGLPAAALRARRRATSPDPVVVEVVEDGGRFAELRQDWDALLQASPSAGVFLTWEWLHGWWRHLGGRRRLRLLAAWRGRELLALAPLAEAGGLWRLLGLPRLQFLGTGTVGSDYLDVLIRPDEEDAGLRALAAHLADGGASLDLGQLATGVSRAATLASTLAGHGWTASESATDLCPYVRLAGHTWESYLASLGPEHRYNFRRRLRKLEATGAARFEQVVSEERRRVVLPALFELHARRWRTRGGSQAFDAAPVLAFHEEFSRVALERGWLRLHALWLDGRPAAAVYGLRYGPRVSFYQSGFDPHLTKLSVGLVALGLAIRSAIEEGAEEFDLLHGAEPYKFLWTRDARPLSRIELYPPRLAAALGRRLADAWRAARRTARRVLPETVARRIAEARHRGSLRAQGTASAR